VLNLNKARLITEEIAGDGLREIAGDREKLSSLERREQVSE
jgi:hypothetical protein